MASALFLLVPAVLHSECAGPKLRAILFSSFVPQRILAEPSLALRQCSVRDTLHASSTILRFGLRTPVNMTSAG